VIPRPLSVAIALWAAALPGCQGGRRGPPPERFVPANATAVVIVPETGRAARELAALVETVSGFPGAGGLTTARGALTSQLGFDPLDASALRDAGLEARRGAALALLPQEGAPAARGSALLVLPVSRPPKLEALLARLARDRLGAEVITTEPHGAVRVSVFRRAATAPPALADALLEATALVAQGADGPAVVARAAALAQDAALGAAPAFAAARRAAGKESSVLAWLPAGSPLLGRRAALADGAGLGMAAGSGHLVARLVVPLGARAPSFERLAGAGAAAPLVARLDPAAPLACRWDGDPAALGRKLSPLLAAQDRARLAARGLDAERDLFGVLAPGAAVALSLAPGLDLAGLSSEVLRADPLRVVQFDAVLPVRDAAAARAASDALERSRTRRLPRDRVHRIRTGSGEIAWVVDEERGRIVASGGTPGRLEALLARLRGDGDGFRSPTPAGDAALSGGLGGAVLDPQRLVASVRALPPDAFGTGPTGFVVRSVVDRIVAPAERLAALSLRADLGEGALVVSLEVEARSAGGARE
jgi:hypothetical protein